MNLVESNFPSRGEGRRTSNKGDAEMVKLSKAFPGRLRMFDKSRRLNCVESHYLLFI